MTLKREKRNFMLAILFGFKTLQRKKRLSPKLHKYWEGPYQVIQNITDVVFRIKISSSSRPKVIYINRLALYNINGNLKNGGGEIRSPVLSVVEEFSEKFTKREEHSTVFEGKILRGLESNNGNIFKKQLEPLNTWVLGVENRIYYQQLHAVRFRNKIQAEGKTLQEVSNDLQRLSRLVLPSCTRDIQDFQTQKQFVEALRDPEM
ncbi:hypothetical protein LAZ67_20000789 [Cordylochernes scorpioides]|uniref:Integrase p58-like C-terminal domain-containing protein n=1 Tax=Cordylochernes scorpioides TaxID=51811 RepID=A0ABY6LN98_9ARAC|nr:hypothetical protein LAZ67_20000789 [Cordylochernes scorpioides]